MENFILDLRDVPKELILSLEMLKNDDFGYIQNYIRKEYENIDWKIFLDLTVHHRVYPLIYSKIQNIGDSLIPPFVIQRLSKMKKINIFKMLHLSGEMEQLANLFHTKGINAIYLKGPILGKEIYGDVSLRTSGDLDLIIPIEDLDIVHNLLEINGYVKDDYIQSVLEDWKWRHHHVTYYHPSKNVKVEIHWRLNPGPGKEPKFSDLWERKRKSILSNSPIYFLGREDLFLFLVSHGARHGWSRLRWLMDIRQMIEKGLDWEEIQFIAKDYNNSHVIGQSIILATQLLNANVDTEIKGFFINNQSKLLAQGAIFYFKKMINLHNYPLPEDVSSYHVRHLYSLMSHKQKLLFRLSFLYPYHIDTLTLPLPKKLHFLYFILRPFLSFWRRARKQELS